MKRYAWIIVVAMVVLLPLVAACGDTTPPTTTTTTPPTTTTTTPPTTTTTTTTPPTTTTTTPPTTTTTTPPTTTDITPPAAPTNLWDRTNEGDEEVALDWDDNTEADLASYNIYRADEAVPYDYSKINTYLVTVSEYVDGTVEEDWPYYYRVTAVDTNGNESARSNRVSGKTLC